MVSVNKERVQMLVDALESGEFEQCKGSLRLKEANGRFTYCCLGVATEIAVRNGLPQEIGDTGRTVWAHDGGEVLCKEVRDWYGFDHESPRLEAPSSGTFRRLPAAAHQWNDSYGADFHQIAGMFRKKYLDGPETPAAV